ncbi:MAG: hypothetical protein OES46_19350 [Gammaproteobacteria bacterium]|nr:hypothetical protein [Gammaproteobacteria bacterium]
MKNRADIWYLVSAGVLFGLFLLNIFLGKAALLFDMEPILTIGDVGEFVILLAAVICFVIVVLRLESQKSDVKTKSANNAEEDI